VQPSSEPLGIFKFVILALAKGSIFWEETPYSINYIYIKTFRKDVSFPSSGTVNPASN
jgi:hypothetical protein